MFSQKHYLTIAIVIFLIEVAIAAFVHDAFLRPFGGDFLVVILIYTLVRGVTPFSVVPTIVGTLLFSFFIEALQFINFVEIIGLEKVKIARVVLGTSFSWLDILAYSLGALFVFFVESIITIQSSK
ncbi:DUF2809 domain-containing protein [Runella sp. SP2]|uniref:ribosomal maturation YjgA family protein n=1 Tax=Runella sp. SP2 TaxID=2268026 RepID=UPI000F0817BD|nr:DUF2809 domain-containing protein [Runella sp. SP2]AYQ32511.1 DUF2809 domain-containing protein [Runella sp. SP2]